MSDNNLVNWLVIEKHMNKRSAKDVLSRCGRINRMLKTDVIDQNSLELLLECEKYKESSMFVKSQLKRAIALYLEFAEHQDGK